jgi:hypothetical protein
LIQIKGLVSDQPSLEDRIVDLIWTETSAYGRGCVKTPGSFTGLDHSQTPNEMALMGCLSRNETQVNPQVKNWVA